MPTEQSPSPDLVVLGCPSIDRLLVRGLEQEAPGGAALGTALAARLCGARVGLVARVPRELPPALAHVFGPGGLDRGGLVTQTGPLPTFRITYDHEHRSTYADTSFGIEEDLCADDVPDAWLSAPLLHIASVNGSASRQLAILRALRARGFRGEVSVGTYRQAVDREPEAVRTLMGESDLCFMNREEATLLYPNGVPARPTGVLCITDGSEAIEVVGKISAGRHPVTTLEVTDATGAGDAFCGGFLAGYLTGQEPVIQGMRVAGQVLQDYGVAPLLRQVAARVSPRVVVNEDRVEELARALTDAATDAALDFCGGVFPPADAPLALEMIAAATLHQYGFWTSDDNGYIGPMYAELDGRLLKGSDFVWAAFARAARSDPTLLSPARMASEPDLLAHICTADDGTCPLPALHSHQELHQGYGQALLEQPNGFRSILERANASEQPGASLLKMLKEVPGYAEDPLAKKANLLVIMLANRPEAFLDLRDPECVEPIVDYHLMRGCLRTGCVDLLDPDLARRMMSRQWVDLLEEDGVRTECLTAIRSLVRYSGHTVAQVDGFFFVNGRTVCFETEAPHCEQCPIESACAQRTGLFQPIFRTTAY